jgi:hypothetical protein
VLASGDELMLNTAVVRCTRPPSPWTRRTPCRTWEPGWSWWRWGEYDRALEHYAHAADLVGTPFPATLALVAHAEALAGRRERAVAMERDLLRQRGAGVYVPPHYLAIVALGHRGSGAGGRAPGGEPPGAVRCA